MEIKYLLIGIIYLIGILLAGKMMKIEHDSEDSELTIGLSILMKILSLLSFVIVLIMLVKAWVLMIDKTGYWNKPLNKKAG